MYIIIMLSRIGNLRPRLYYYVDIIIIIVVYRASNCRYSILDTLHPPFWVRVPVAITYLFIDLGALFRCGAAVEGMKARVGGGSTTQSAR